MDTPAWVRLLDFTAQPLKSAQLKEWALQFPLLIVRNFPLTPEGLLELGTAFGRPLKKAGVSPVIHLLPKVENTDRRETFSSVTPMEWHSDRSFDPETPRWSLLYAESIGRGAGETVWANSHLAFENLPDDLKRECLPLECVHSLSHFSQTYDDEIYGFASLERQKRVFDRCQTAKKLVEFWNDKPYLNINRGYTSKVIGKDELFLNRLLTYCEDPRVSYIHHWKSQDLAISNNRILIHARRKSHGLDRVMHRVLIL